MLKIEQAYMGDDVIRYTLIVFGVRLLSWRRYFGD